jgi:hypothetical protein
MQQQAKVTSPPVQKQIQQLPSPAVTPRSTPNAYGTPNTCSTSNSYNSPNLAKQQLF